MSQSLNLKIKGLYTSDNKLSAVPEGALTEADNIVIDREGIAEPRRGFNRLSAAFATASHRANQLWFYQDKLMAHTSANQLQYWSGSAWAALAGTFTKPTGAVRVRAAEANQNLYLTTSSGIYKQDAYSSAPALAGAYKALDLVASTTGSSGFLANNQRVTYRVLWGYKDANNNLILGAPSQRESIRNVAGSSRDVSLTFTVPTGVTTAWFYQVYRSAIEPDTDGTVENNDELQLVYEANYVSGTTITVTDSTPDELRGALIYTASSQEGLSKGNEQPPLAQDVAYFKGHTFYANIISKHRFYLTLVAVGGSGGVTTNDTVALGGITYTAKTTETIASAQFRAYLSGTFTFVDADVNTGTEVITHASHGMQDDDPISFSNSGGALPGGLSAGTTYYVISSTTNTFKVSATKGGSAVNITSAAGGGTHTATYGGSAAQNIRDTALSLVRVINRYSSSTVYAYYLSGVNDLPGKILLEERSIGGGSFACTSSRATCWSPQLPTSGTTQSSTNDTYPNGVMWSKPGQPEAVPLPYFAQAGSKNKAISRIVALRDTLFILKKGEGIYRLTGDSADNFSIELFDNSTNLLAPESCAVVAGQLFCLTDQGVVAISETGVSVVSRAIEKDLLALFGASLTGIESYSFGVGYDSARKYILWTISSAADTYATQAYVYNEFTATWTRWTLAKRCGIVSPQTVDDKLYLGDAASEYVNVERKTYDATDSVDYGFSTTITAVSVDLTTVTLGSLIDEVDVGDVIYQSDSVFGIVTSIDTVNATATVSAAADFSVAACDILKAIDTRITWAPMTLSNPGALKHWHTAIFLFESDFSGTGTARFSSDLDPAEDTVDMVGSAIGNWGLFGWGQIPWGGEATTTPHRVWIPRSKQVSSQLVVGFSHAVGYSGWELAGVSLYGNPGSDRVAR